MGLLDKFKALFAKKQSRSYFKGAEFSRLTQDWVTSPLTADDELRSDVRRLRSRSRELARNSPIIRQYLGMLAVNVIGPKGFTHQAEVADNSRKLNRRINDNIEAAWKHWSKSVTLDGRLSLVKFQHQLIQAVARDGEVLVRMWRVPTSVNCCAFALEAIDADLLDERLIVGRTETGNEIRMGVEVDSYNRPVAYHVWNRPDSIVGSSLPRFRQRVPASEVIHLYDPERVNQTRGVPWTAAVMMPLRMLEGYIEAELVAARTAAAKMGFFVRKDGTMPGAIETDERGIISTEANPGTFDFAPEGYELQDWSPDHPNAVFADFVKGALRQVATGLRMSYNALANDLEGVNYSSMRSGLLIERDMWRALQTWWTESFLDRVYDEWLAQALLSGELKADTRNFSKLLAHKFIGRGWQWVDPLKDASAGELALANGLTSRTRLLAEQGIDVESVFQELAREDELADEYGVDLKELGPPDEAPSSSSTPQAMPSGAEDDAQEEDAQAASVSESDAQDMEDA